MPEKPSSERRADWLAARADAAHAAGNRAETGRWSLAAAKACEVLDDLPGALATMDVAASRIPDDTALDGVLVAQARLLTALDPERAIEAWGRLVAAPD